MSSVAAEWGDTGAAERHGSLALGTAVASRRLYDLDVPLYLPRAGHSDMWKRFSFHDPLPMRYALSNLDRFSAHTADANWHLFLEDCVERSDHRNSDAILEAISRTLARGRGAAILSEFADYTVPDWDCEGAEPISKESIDIAAKLIDDFAPPGRTPDAAPGADGSIGLEWWNGGSRLFIDIGPGKHIGTYLNLGNGRPEEDVWQWGDADLGTRLETLFKQLYQPPADAGTASDASSADLAFVAVIPFWKPIFGLGR